jgi:hypothetical protein
MAELLEAPRHDAAPAALPGPRAVVLLHGPAFTDQLLGALMRLAQQQARFGIRLAPEGYAVAAEASGEAAEAAEQVRPLLPFALRLLPPAAWQEQLRAAAAWQPGAAWLALHRADRAPEPNWLHRAGLTLRPGIEAAEAPGGGLAFTRAALLRLPGEAAATRRGLRMAGLCWPAPASRFERDFPAAAARLRAIIGR